jgi:hypothetical protein
MLKELITLLLVFGSLSIQGQSVKYVWPLKLNLRDSPGLDGKVIHQLNRVQEVKILKVTDKAFQTTETVVKRHIRFDQELRKEIEQVEKFKKELKGQWVLIKVDELEGYVFGVYLSSLDPGPFFDTDYEALELYFKENFSCKKERFGCSDCDSYYSILTSSNQELILLRGIVWKSSAFELKIKGISKYEGEMIGFYLFGDYEGNACSYLVEEKDNFVIIQHGCSC